MPIPRIVAFTGAPGVGKSVLAQVVSETWGHEPHSFAETLKEIARDMYALDMSPLRTAKAMLKRGEPVDLNTLALAKQARARLVEIATAMRALSPDCFLRMVMRFADMTVERGGDGWVPGNRLAKVWNGLYAPKIVIDDLRFRNEFYAVKKRGGVVVQVKGPSLWEGTHDDIPGENEIAMFAGECPTLDVTGCLERARRALPSQREAAFRANVQGMLSILFDEAIPVPVAANPRASVVANDDVAWDDDDVMDANPEELVEDEEPEAIEAEE